MKWAGKLAGCHAGQLAIGLYFTWESSDIYRQSSVKKPTRKILQVILAIKPLQNYICNTGGFSDINGWGSYLQGTLLYLIAIQKLYTVW